MPELPEVEAARRIIESHVVGHKVLDVDAADDAKVFDGASPSDLRTAFLGRRVTGAHRKGKQLWLTLSGDGPQPLMHFGMTGFIAVKEEGSGAIHMVAYENAPSDTASAWPPRFHKLLLRLDGPGGGVRVAFCDARRFGRLKLVQGDPAASEVVAKLGFDALAMPSEQEFAALLSARARGATRLKPLLLDQGFIAGVGNWVADEVLWLARLHPEQLVAALEPSHVAALHGALRTVVHTAVAANADSSRYPPDWMFHVRWGKRAGTLCGHKLDHITVGSRTSCFVPALQQLIGGAPPPAKAKAKPPGATKRKKAPKVAAASSDDSSGDTTSSSSSGSLEGQQEAGEDAGPSSASKKRKPAARRRRTAAAADAPAVAAKAEEQPQASRRRRQQSSAAQRGGRRAKAAAAGDK